LGIEEISGFYRIVLFAFVVYVLLNNHFDIHCVWLTHG